MAQYIVPQTILGKNIGFEVFVVVQPIVGKFLWTQNENGAVPKFIVFYDC